MKKNLIMLIGIGKWWLRDEWRVMQAGDCEYLYYRVVEGSRSRWNRDWTQGIRMHIGYKKENLLKLFESR